MIRLHHAPDARSMRIIWLLEELGVAYELISHNFFDKSMRTEAFRGLSPAGRVPALEIDGISLVESGAMVEVLCERFPNAGLGRSFGDAERIEWLDWLHYAETIGQHCANLTQSHIMLYEAWMRSPTVMKLEAARLANTLKRIEAQLSDGRDWLLKSGFSAVDCAVAYGIYAGTHFVKLDALPLTSAYWERFQARSSFGAALPPVGAEVIYKQDFYEVPND
ncbi:glutathione S-transferase family protein [Cochlodiniinecator piscidefendens]|uniref:glutathione S-transferase family protein n=1 Tax=Cochlodiniinecator piscidefendens TaxID=2715756 RepID=UPI00140C6B88|nr:glutathione S-transferase [Cochlodiniinecator piscidefendens]